MCAVNMVYDADLHLTNRSIA